MNPKILLPGLLWLCLYLPAMAQVQVQPVVGSKTHPSMTVDSVVFKNKSTVFHLEVINENTEGTAWFCADSNISLVEKSNGRKHKLVKSSGIPVCPDAHQFTRAGERLNFKLIFPKLENPTSEVDIVENCADNCFSLLGIVLDPELNLEIRMFESGVAFFKKDQFIESLKVFEFLSKSEFKKENHYAYSLYILPVLHYRLGNEGKAKSSYKDLSNSEINEKKYFLDKIHEIAFFANLK